jgi:hypothetical protein
MMTFSSTAPNLMAFPDLRLALLVEVDDLGVAAALEVEDAVVVPAVLVVADQLALRVGGQRGLAGAGEAEEERDIRCRCRSCWPSSASENTPCSGM